MRIRIQTDSGMRDQLAVTYPVIQCARCGEPFEKTNGRKKYCTPCGPLAEKERAIVRRAETADARKEYMTAWRAQNVDKLSAYAREYSRPKYKRHIGDVVRCPDCGDDFVLNSARRTRCPPCAEFHRKSHSASKAAEWNRINKDRRQIRLNERYASDPAIRLNVLMANGIGESLGGAKGGRKWQDLVDYSLEDLIAHLKSKFTNGMTLENHGSWPDGWHVDHIRPKASFSFTSPDDPQFKECWALSNLQPLWAPDNLSKSKKWEPLAAAA